MGTWPWLRIDKTTGYASTHPRSRWDFRCPHHGGGTASARASTLPDSKSCLVQALRSLKYRKVAQVLVTRRHDHEWQSLLHMSIFSICVCMCVQGSVSLHRLFSRLGGSNCYMYMVHVVYFPGHGTYTTCICCSWSWAL